MTTNPEPFRLVPAWLARKISDSTQPEVSHMAEQTTPDPADSPTPVSDAVSALLDIVTDYVPHGFFTDRAWDQLEDRVGDFLRPFVAARGAGRG